MQKTTLQFAIVCVLMGLFFSSFGQPKKGDFLLGGNLSFNRQKGFLQGNNAENVLTENRFKLFPQVGVFVSRSFALGFSTQVDYSAKSINVVLRDSLNNKFNRVENEYVLIFGFGLHFTHYRKLGEGFFWVNSLEPRWGSKQTGDKLSSFFSEDKPQQERNNFVRLSYSTGISYFVKPNLSISLMYNPIEYVYNYKKIVRNNQPTARQNGHNISFSNVPNGLFFGISYLIIGDDNEN